MKQNSAIDLTGTRFGRLVPIVHEGHNKHRNALWRCRCDCGNEVVALSGNLRKGHTQSCGCFMKEMVSQTQKGRADTHGHHVNGRPSRTYRTWRSMVQRCADPNNISYKYYGGRGIKVCERWQKFENFLADMGERPQGMTLDRYPDNNGNYEVGNCRWATAIQQRANRRDSRR